MKISELHCELTKKYPKELSCPWDNDGIMCCRDLSAEVKKVLVALDPTKSVIEYAARNGYDTVLTHHPLIFKPLKALTGEDAVSERALTALVENVSVLSFHTRLDASEGGVNDSLAEALGLVPDGKFGDGDSPEIGRLATLERNMSAEELSGYISEKLGGVVRVYGRGMIGRVALLGGSGKDFIVPAMLCGADALITGESGYNAAETAVERGFVIFEAGHYETEAPVCSKLKKAVGSLGITADIYR